MLPLELWQLVTVLNNLISKCVILRFHQVRFTLNVMSRYVQGMTLNVTLRFTEFHSTLWKKLTSNASLASSSREGYSTLWYDNKISGDFRNCAITVLWWSMFSRLLSRMNMIKVRVIPHVTFPSLSPVIARDYSNDYSTWLNCYVIPHMTVLIPRYKNVIPHVTNNNVEQAEMTWNNLAVMRSWPEMIMSCPSSSSVTPFRNSGISARPSTYFPRNLDNC